MSLFVVNRYLGDDNNAEESRQNKNGGIDDLNRKIEERRKLKEIESLEKLEKKKQKRVKARDRKKKELIAIKELQKENLNFHKVTYVYKNKNEKRLKAKQRKNKLLKQSQPQSSVAEDVNKMVTATEERTIISDVNTKVSTSNISEFTVIGGHNFKKNNQIKRVLPEWLAKPLKISSDLKSLDKSVDDISNLDEILINNLKRNDITHFFPVQTSVISWLLSERHSCCTGLKLWPRDICVSAPTGSGKTLAFVLPVIQKLKPYLTRKIRALVVLPVQDLAAQVAKVFRQYAAGTRLKVLTVTGSAMPLQEEQALLVRHKAGVGYESRVDIVVTTPGRLVEHLKATPGFSLHHLKFLVIDEADRVIDHIKNDWLYHLENHLSSAGIGSLPPLTVNTLTNQPVRPQKLLFSATLTQDPEKLKQLNLFQPRLFKCLTDDNQENPEGVGEFVGKLVIPSELEQRWVVCRDQLKPVMLYHILANEGWRGVLCFTHYTDAAHRLARLLSLLSAAGGLNLSVEEISSEISYSKRNEIVSGFTTGKIDVLVCSDAYARGMDITGVRYVVLYTPPRHIENYIHQVGRTARAGITGTALTFLDQSQVRRFRQMLKSSSSGKLEELNVKETELSYLEKIYSDSLFALKNETTKEQKEGTEKLKYTKRKQRGIHLENLSKKRKVSKATDKSKSKSKM